MGFVEQLQKGYAYLEAWPMISELSVRFPENRVITATRLGIKVMPALAVITVFLPIILKQMHYLPQSAFIALVFFCLPVHGLLWLSKRAETILPLNLVSWYEQIKQTLIDEGEDIAEHSPLRYRHLAFLLSKASQRALKV